MTSVTGKTQPNITIARIQEFYARIKKVLPEYPIAFAGGCVRDVICNRPVKDFDLYIQITDWDHESPLEASEDIDTCISRLDKLLFSDGKPKSKGHDITDEEARSYKDSHIRICDVWGYDHAFNDMPCDVIFVKDELTVTFEDGFDFGLCQAWVGHYGLRTTKWFWRDYHNKIITYMFSPADQRQYKASQEHLARILPKYPGWRPRDIAI